MDEVTRRTKPKCATCIHFVPMTAFEGMCTAKPPQVARVMRPIPRQSDPRLLGVSAVLQTLDLADDTTAFFPRIRPDRGCGEHPDFAQWYQNAGKVAVLDLEPVLEPIIKDMTKQ